MRARGLRPGGQPVAAQLLWRSRLARGGTRVAYLYETARALPVRAMTPGRWRAHAAMMRARRTCPTCRTDAGYCIPRSLGMCVACAFPEEQRAA